MGLLLAAQTIVGRAPNASFGVLELKRIELPLDIAKLAQNSLLGREQLEKIGRSAGICRCKLLPAKLHE